MEETETYNYYIIDFTDRSLELKNFGHRNDEINITNMKKYILSNSKKLGILESTFLIEGISYSFYFIYFIYY